jgi:peptidoglycan/LPS O-acetylase OafA/YrhL
MCRCVREDRLSVLLLSVSIIFFLFRFILLKYLFFNSIFMDSIFFGSILGFLRRNFSLNFLISNYILLVSLILLIIFSLVDFSFISSLVKHGYRGFFGLLSCLVIINLVYSSSSYFIFKILRSKLFVFFGRLSYSLYLWHSVVFYIFGKIIFFEGYQNFILKFIFSFVMAYISYFFIERKLLKYSKRQFSVN